jgi:hypothetical protein
MINVTGTVYFAITPKCVMGGGGLHMGLDVGPVSAWLDILLDVFIQFKPFYYTADLSVSVGCAISINVWFVHVTIKVSVGAALHIQGPDPFGGVGVFSFPSPFHPPIHPPIIPMKMNHTEQRVYSTQTSTSTSSPSQSTSATNPPVHLPSPSSPSTKW